MVLNFRLFSLGCCLLFLAPDPILCHIYETETPLMSFVQPIEVVETSSGMPKIDCIYVINLDRRPEKWARMKAILEEQNLHPNRVSGIDGWQLTPEAIETMIGPYPLRRPLGNFGCLLSHLSIIKHAHDNGYKYIWIMEDDIEIADDISQIPLLMENLSNIAPGWDVLYTDPDSKDNQGTLLKSVGSDFRPDRKDLHPSEWYLTRKIINDDLMLNRQRFGLYSYILSKRGIKKILDYFSHVYFWTAIDIDIHYIPHIKEYSTTRDIVTIWTGCTISDTAESGND